MAENDARLASSEMYESITSLPPAKRYIVTHNEQGKSTIHSSPALQFYGYPGVGGTARSCESQRFVLFPTIANTRPAVDARLYN
jgi:hypothetical protein